MREMQRILAAALRTEVSTAALREKAPEGDRSPSPRDSGTAYAASPVVQPGSMGMAMQARYMAIPSMAQAVSYRRSRGYGFALAVIVGIGLLIALLSDRVELYWNAVLSLDWILIGELIWVLICWFTIWFGTIQFVRPRSRVRGYLGGIAQKNFELFWVFVVIGVILIQFVIFTFPIKPLVQMWATTIVWGLFFGSSILFLLPGNLVITFFGFILGIGGSEIDSGAGLISSVRLGVSEIAAQIVDLAAELGGEPDQHLKLMVWVFFVLVFVLCLPAFFRSGVESLAKNLEKKDS